MVDLLIRLALFIQDRISKHHYDSTVKMYVAASWHDAQIKSCHEAANNHRELKQASQDKAFAISKILK